MNGVRALRAKGPQRGFTLIELMVSLAILMFIAMVIVFVASSVFRSNAQSIQMIQLSQEMRSSIQLISRDIRRSGYNDDALSGFLTTESIDSGVTMGDLDVNGVADCLQVRYEDLDGLSRNAVYRLRVISSIGRVSAHFGASATCATALDDNDWSDVSDPVLTHVSALDFVLEDQLTEIAESLSTGNTIMVGLEQVNIVISANLRGDPSVNRSVITEVQLRNQYLVV